MPESEEVISLVIRSPKIALDPIERAIEKIREFDEILERVAKSRTVKINLGIEGGLLEGAVANVKLLEAVLTAAGKADWATGLKNGLMTSGEVAKSAAGEIAKVKRELDELTAKLRVNREEWGRMSARGESGDFSVQQEKQLSSARKMLEMQETLHRELQGKLAGLGTAHGMASAMAGLPEANQDAAKSVQQATSAMAVQTTAAERNAIAMERTAAAAEKVAKANGKAAQAVRASDEQYQQIADRVLREQSAAKPIAPTAHEETAIRAAYHAVKKETGMPGAPIADVMERAGFGTGEMERAKGILAHLYQQGQIPTLPSGDWAESDPRKRAWGTRERSGDSPGLLMTMGGGGVGGPPPSGPPLSGAGEGPTGPEDSRRNTLLRRRVRTAGGEGPTESNTYLEGPGRTRTVSGETVTQEMDAERAAKQRFAAIKAEFTRRRAEISGLGKSAPEMREMLRQEAAAVQDELSKSGLSGTSLFEEQRGRAAGLLEQAGKGEYVADRQKQVARAKADLAEQKRVAKEAAEEQRRSADYKKELSGHIKTSLDLEMKQLGGLESASRKANMTDEERISVLRKLAAEYERVAMAAGASGPNREGVRVGASNRAGLLRSEAGAAEERLAQRAQAEAAETQRIAAMLSSHQAELGAFGGKQLVTRESASGSGRTETTSATRSLDGQEQALTLTRRWNAEGKEMAPILARNTKEMGDMEHGLGSLGEEFIGSLRGMTIWTAATSLLYGTIGVFGEGVATVVKMERATEGLSQTWGKGGAQAAQLRNDVLALAAAEGRGADEAMAAAARWSHMHLSKDDTAEAVHQSLIAANLAAAGGEEGADAEEKAKQLAAATEAYGLQVSSLASLLDDLNSVTHGLNVTQKDLLDGLDKTAAMAKHAGLPIRELISMIGVGVSASGQSGGQVGTTLRQIMGAVYNPNTQAKLESNFGIDVKTSTGDLKQMDAILESIVARYQQLNRERQDALLTELVGRRQAGAAGAIFDNFPKVEEVARKAAGDEGSAEKDSQGMAGTTQGELQSMKTDAVKTVTEFWDGASRFLDWLAEKAWGNPDEIKKDFDDAKKEAARKAAEAGSNGAPVPVVGAADGVDKSRKDIPKEVTAAKEEAADQRAKRYARLAGYERQVIGVTNEGLPNARGTQSEDVARKLAALNQEEAGLKREDPRFVAQDKAIKEQAQRSLNAANDAQDVPAQYTGAVRYYRDQSAQEAKRLQEMQGARAAMDQMPDAVARKEYLTGPDGSKEKGRLHEITLEREKLENDGRIARIKDDMAEGGRISNRRFSAFDVGSNETERLASEARGGASLVNDAVGRNKAALGRGESGAREAAEAQQLGVNLNQVQLQLEERRYKLARDIVNERLKENEAASKNLVMSGREDQLKAALLAREGQKRGGKGFTNEEFMFFTPETKRAVQDFTPGLLPPAARGERQKLEGEASQLQQIIGPLRKVLDESIARAGGAKVNAPAGTGAPAAPPQINVAPMTFTFSEQFAQISDVLVKAVDARLGPEIAAIGAKVDAIIASRTQGRAQSAGADVIHGGD